MKSRSTLLPYAATAAMAATLTTPASADTLPTGQRTLGQSTLELAYDAARASTLTHLLTPNNAPDPVGRS